MRRLVPLLVLLSCLAAQAAVAQVIFQDSFNSGKAPQWRQINDGPVPGSFSVQQGAYTISSKDPVRSIPRALVTNASTGDYYIQADVTITPLVSSFAAASLIADYTNSNNYYEFLVDGRNLYWSLNKYDKETLSPLATGPVSISGPSFHLGLYVRQGDVRAFVNGVMVAEELDSSQPPGVAFGLCARGAQARWDNVRVVVANPQVFFYAFTTLTTSASGTAAFPDAVFQVVDQNNHALPNIRVYRIHRDALSYFIFEDPAGKFGLLTGFATEFTNTGGKNFRVALTPAGAGYTTRTHRYTSAEIDWLFAFIQRSARFATQGVTANLVLTRNVYLLGQSFVVDDAPLSPGAIGNGRAEVNGLIFGPWEAFGDYNYFPSVEGPVGQPLLSSFAAISRAPDGSLFKLFVLRVQAGSQAPANVAFFVQDDSRALVSVDSVQFPTQLNPGTTYTASFTIANHGQAAGAFQLFIKLSPNPFMGPKDTTLAQMSFDGLQPGGSISQSIQFQAPNIPGARYFIGTFLQPVDRNSKTLRVRNDSGSSRPVTVGSFPANGPLTVVLNWAEPADLDLHLTDPYGETIYYYHPRSFGGGVLEEDSQCTPNASREEKIDYPYNTAAAGTYTIGVDYIQACGAQAVRWTVTVTSDHGSQTFSGTIQPGQYQQAGQYTR